MKVKTKVAIVFNKQKIIQYSIKYLTFTVGLAMAIVLIFPANAETERSQSSSLTNIEVGNDAGWQFSSEEESVSIEDEISELGDYSILEAERELNQGTVVKPKRWGNRGDVEDFQLDTNIYEY